MADQFPTLYDSEENSDFTSLDYLEVIVNEEYQTKLNNLTGRYKKQANLTHTNAHLSDINTLQPEGLP